MSPCAWVSKYLMDRVSMWLNRSVRSLSRVPVDMRSISRAYMNVDSAPNRYTNAIDTSVRTKPLMRSAA